MYTPSEMEALLKSTAYPLSGACSGGCGAGIINAKALVDAAGGSTPPPPPPPPPTGGTLTKGVAVTGLAATTGNSVNYTMVVPTGSTNLTFTMSGGTGDADMYVQFGTAPTDTSYICRPYLGGNAETCTIAAPSAGTYHVRLKAYSSFSGVSLVGNYTTGTTPPPSGTTTYSNTADYQIRDNTTVDSPITVSGRSGNASSTSSVSVNIVHTYKGDLKVDLVAPDGTLYNIHNRTGSSTDNIIGTFSRNLSTELLNGTWKLRVNDNAGGDTGYINSWSITF
jgi:serine protease